MDQQKLILDYDGVTLERKLHFAQEGIRPEEELRRDADGKFRAGNKGGPGNPFNRRVSEMRKAMVEAVSQDETLVTAFAGHVYVTMGEQSVTIGPGQEVDAVTGHSLAVQTANGSAGGTADDRYDGKHDNGMLPRLLTVSATGELQLYAQPRTDAAPVGRVPAGRSLTIMAEDPTGGWVQVCCIAGNSGWLKVR